MKITHVDVGAAEKFPMILPSDFLQVIDKRNKWDVLCGKPTLEAACKSFSVFWSKYEVLYPNFTFFDVAREGDIPYDRGCPIYVHGDEGTHYKRSGIMILQWQGALGAGTSRNVNANTRDAQGVNSLGNTLKTRLLVGAMPKAAPNQFQTLLCI